MFGLRIPDLASHLSVFSTESFTLVEVNGVATPFTSTRVNDSVENTDRCDARSGIRNPNIYNPIVSGKFFDILGKKVVNRVILKLVVVTLLQFHIF